jgi:hypothetical protein
MMKHLRLLQLTSMHNSPTTETRLQVLGRRLALQRLHRRANSAADPTPTGPARPAPPRPPPIELGNN